MRSESFLQEVVDNMIKTVVERTGADGGVLLLADEFDETVSVRSLFGNYPPPFKLPENLPKDPERVDSFMRHARFKLGEGISGEVSRTGKNVFVPQAGPESPLPDNGDEDWLKIGGFIASPLILRDRIIGAISVVKTEAEGFSERDFDRCKLLANFGSIAVANSFSFLEAAERSDIEREADIAANMQKTLIPKELPSVDGFEFRGLFELGSWSLLGHLRYNSDQVGPSSPRGGRRGRQGRRGGHRARDGALHPAPDHRVHQRRRDSPAVGQSRHHRQGGLRPRMRPSASPPWTRAPG